MRHSLYRRGIYEKALYDGFYNESNIKSAYLLPIILMGG